MDVRFKISETGEQQAVQSDQSLIPATLDNKALQTLQQRVQKESMGLVTSLAKQMAKDAWAGELDTFRVYQAQRVGAETLRLSAEAIARIDDYAGKLSVKYPNIEADIWQMTLEQIDIIKQEPRIAHVGYLRRFHKV